jgi:hypothetical protein
MNEGRDGLWDVDKGLRRTRQLLAFGAIVAVTAGLWFWLSSGEKHDYDRAKVEAKCLYITTLGPNNAAEAAWYAKNC